MVAAALSAELIAAGEDEARQVQSSGCHELAGCCLVAGCEQNHAVEHGALDLYLDVVHEEVTRGHQVAPALACRSYEVGRGDCPDFEGQAPGLADRRLDGFRDHIEMLVAHR